MEDRMRELVLDLIEWSHPNYAADLQRALESTPNGDLMSIEEFREWLVHLPCEDAPGVSDED